MQIQEVFVGQDSGYCNTNDPYGGRDKHEWSTWESHEEGGLTVITRGKRIGHWEVFSKEWQERQCSKCGAKQRSGL